MFTVQQDNINFDDSYGEAQLPKPLNSLTHSLKCVENTRKRFAIPLICGVIILQNISDFSVVSNMVWMVSLVSNSSWHLLQCNRGNSSIPPMSQLSTAEGATTTLCYYLLVAIFSIYGGYLGDTKLGRYRTIRLAVFLSMIGTAVYLALALILKSSTEDNHHGYKFLIYIFLAISIIVFGAGMGIHSANIIPFGIEQFFDAPIEELSESENYHRISKGIHLLYFAKNVGCFITFSAISSIQENTWVVGFCLPLVCCLITAIPLLAGERFFVVNVPRGNMSSLFISVVKEGYKLSKVPDALSNIDLHFLDYARKEYGGSFEREDVKAVKQMFALAKILSIYMVYFMLYSQMHTTFYLQGLFLKTPQKFPFAGAEAINNLTILIMIPLLIYKVYPWFIKWNSGPLSPFDKSQIGFALIALSMVVAGILEYYRIIYADPLFNSAIQVNLNFFSLIDVTINQSLEYYIRFPQYILIAFSEVLVVIVALQLAYIEAPRQFKSAAMGIFYMFNALGTLLAVTSLMTIQIITYYANNGFGWICQDLNVGKLYKYFYLLCGCMIANMIILSLKKRSFELLISH